LASLCDAQIAVSVGGWALFLGRFAASQQIACYFDHYAWGLNVIQFMALVSPWISPKTPFPYFAASVNWLFMPAF